MKNNFQSKAVPRGTRTIWRYLGALFILFTFAIGNVWAATDAPSGVRNQSSLSYATTDTLHRGGQVYEVFWCNPTSGDIKTKLVKKTHNCTNYEAAGSDKFCVVGSSVSSTTASATANTIDEFTWTASSSPRYWRVRRDGIANYQMVLVVKGYSGVAALHKAGNDLLIKVERYNTATSAYESYTPETTSVSSAVSSHYKTYASLDAADQFKITFYGSGTSGTSNRDMLAFSLKVPVQTTNYTVTIDPNGGSYASTPDGWTYDDVNKKYTKSFTSGTSFSAPAGLTKGTDDLSWKDNHGTTITFPVTLDKDSTFVAQWAAHTASSDATLSALSVAGCTFNETFASATTAYTVDLPFYASMPATTDVTATKNDANAKTPAVSISGNVITVACEAEDGSKLNYTITVTIADAPTASSSINIEQAVLDHGTKYDIDAAFAAAHIAYDKKGNTDELDSLKNQNGRNEPYLGLKMKKTDASITVVVPASSTLKVKFGNLPSAGIKVTINGVAQANHTSGNFELAATSAIREVVLAAPSTSTIVFKQIMVGEDIKSVQLPWLVTYDAGEHGTCATAKETWKGTALTLPSLATLEDGWSFDGWNDGANTYAAGASYDPTADVTLTAQYTALASPFDLTALTYKIGTGDAVNVGYEDGTFTYNIELPYKPSYDAITVAPTLKVGTSYLKGDEVLTVSSLPGAATFTVVEAGGANEKLYTVNFTKAPKEPICLIWGNVANNSLTRDATKSQLNGTLANSNVRDNAVTLDDLVGPKFQSNGYLSIALEGQDIKAGDQVKIFVTSLNGLTDKLRVFNANEAVDANVVAISAENMTTRVNTVTMTENASTIYLRRGNDYSSWNPCVAYVAVYRAMNPVLTAITFDGVDADQDSEFAFSATLPQGTNLGTMTVTPTIVWNGAGSAAPTAAWAWGANTYRVTDKDGDYTDYTITLTEALAPSAEPTITTQPAGANYYEGATIAALEVVAIGSGDLSYQWYLGSDEIDGATAATYTPTVSAIGTYVYHCVVTNTEAGHPATSLASDEATITISEDPAAIKLLNGSTVNHTNFITGVTADETVEFMGNTVNYAKFSGTVGGVNGVKDLTRVIAYNATTTQTKIKVSVHNNSTNARSCYVKGLVEGADAAVDLATISLTNKEDKISDWITFDNAANRTIYIFVSSDAGDVYFTQVKVIESGTDLKMAGEAGYSLNFDHGRFFGVKDATAHFEELDVEVRGSDCQTLNTSVVKLANSSIIFDVTAPVTLTVTTNNNKTYYVTKGAAGTDNETAYKGASDFDLTAGTWYITGGASNVEIKSIAFALPKCEQPTITPMSNSDLCEGDDFAPLTVSATVSDEGTLHYAWFKEAGETDEAVGTDAASYTPEADGEYYVIVTNRKDGFSDNSATSNTVTVTHFAAAVITTAPSNVRKAAGTNVTLTVVATGKELQYTWKESETIDGTYTDVAGAADAASLDITVGAGVKYYKVVVSSACGDPVEAISKVEEWAEVAQVNVTTSTVWEWNNAVEAADESSVASSGAAIQDDPSGYTVLANVEYIRLDDDFKSNALVGKSGLIAWRSSDYKAFQGSGDAMLKFHPTVAGKVRILTSSSNKNKDTEIKINAYSKVFQTTGGGRSAAIETEWVEVPADADVIIGAGASQSLRIYRIEFLALAHQRTTGYAAGDLGTVCLEDATVIEGATLYELQGLDEHGYLAFDEILSGELEAGKPYLFQVTNPSKISFYKPVGAAHSDTEITIKGMVGTFSGTTLTQGEDDICYFAGRHIWRVNDFSVDIDVDPHRCYVNYDVLRAVPAAPAAAPGRRRVIMGVNGKDEAQGFENLESGDAPMKIMIDGTLYILRGEKVFDATGRLVK